MTARALLAGWLARQLSADAAAWLKNSAAQIQASSKDADLYLSVSLVTRKVGKTDLALTEADLREAKAARPDWNPRDWSTDQAARVLLLLALEQEPPRLARALDQLCNSADVSELIAFYRGLPLYPDPSRYLARATEGLRTNIKGVFEAIALRNPYPSEQFPQAAWNQMVLKALFVGSALWPVVGLDRRANPELASMLCDYAHERWSAGRPVSPELWRCVGPHAAGAMLNDLERVLRSGTEPERRAAALALRASPDPAAGTLLQRDAALAKAVAGGELTWERVVATT
ncbi:MAG TPA: EboA domain-containing protein [Burkholderiales bacterium]|nr:EboA domain-containing protein [Burkholderiales bacterium]